MWIPIIISNLLAGTALSSATAGGGGTKNSVKATLLSTVRARRRAPCAPACFSTIPRSRSGRRTAALALVQMP